MYIEINDNTTFRDIQEAFANFYPYLQIEFYKLPHKKYEASQESNAVYPGNTVSEVKQTHVSGVIEIHPWYKVTGVEMEFQNRFGLFAQILRKEKNKWVQTTGMDDFTLKELNELSRNSSDDFIISEPDSEYKDEK
ncbi:MAG TPA: hypothetical protein VFN30_07745 [Chitinophagaceae bacterium]|nr:hypothetical protein [Chitinophagaceae bacterium]